MSDFEDQIAIIGMAGRFPGAADVDEFWSNIKMGVESIRPLSREELAQAGVDPSSADEPGYVCMGAPLDDADAFDAEFFGYLPREAELMDPQHRLFLECAWSALEDAGCDPGQYDGLVGVFGGVARNTYHLFNAEVYRSLLTSGAVYEATIGSDKDFVATRVAFKLDLRGPCMNVQTACSSSGVAIHLACQSLLAGECDVALAGGARVRVPLQAGYPYVEGGIASPDGHCRPFDVNAQGTVYASGGAMVVLKRVEDALADGDLIRCVIRGSAVSNDGAAKVGYTAPGVEGQTAVIRAALEVADVAPDSIGYVEAHGTGTWLGDPIEITALTAAYRESTTARNYCPIGALKANIGHLDAGAGVAGVIKTALMLQDQKLVPSINYENPNPQIDFDKSPFYVNTALRDWPAQAPRRAGVSSFGMGGTNAHIVMEEAPPSGASGNAEGWQVLPLSARTETALQTIQARLANHLAENPDCNLADVAHTLQQGRRPLSKRTAFVCRSAGEAAKALVDPDYAYAVEPTTSQTLEVAFAFSGQGTQYPGMGRELYAREPVFRAAMDRCLDGLDKPLRDLLLNRPLDADMSELNETGIVQPALFAFEYALAQLWVARGLAPTAFLGHSLGEYVGACLAGVFSLEDGLRIVAKRGELMQSADPGAMLAVGLPEAELTPMLVEGLALAAINGPKMSVASGPFQAVEALAGQLEAEGISCTRLRTSHAFHSPMMEPAARKFEAFLEDLVLQAPEIPVVSNVTGTWMTAQEATSPGYWADHIRQPVRFADCVATALADPGRCMLEIGPGRTLTNLALLNPGRNKSAPLVATISNTGTEYSECAELELATGHLWAAGVDIAWAGLHGDVVRHKVRLPTYPFERKRFWLGPQPFGQATNPLPQVGPQTVTEQIQTQAPAVGGNTVNETTNKIDRTQLLVGKIKDIIQDLSGLDASSLEEDKTFLELGFDSLFLTRANTSFRRKFGVKVTFRHLFDEADTIAALAAFIDSKMPPEALADELTQVVEPSAAAAPAVPLQLPAMDTIAVSGDSGQLQQVINQQLQLMATQLAMLQGKASVPAGGQGQVQADQVQTPSSSTAPSSDAGAGKASLSDGFGPFTPIKNRGKSLSDEQLAHVAELTASYNKQTAGSKDLAEKHRKHLADPRTVSGFRREWKELVYPIATTWAKGARVGDVDGNEYVDICMGFGSILLGHSPDFIVDAIKQKLDEGIEVTGRSPLAGEVAGLVCELTGNDRVMFCHSASEAILGAARVARTVTGLDCLVTFAGSYHGRMDAVLGRPVVVNGERRSIPQVSGIPQSMVDDLIILDWAESHSLEYIKENASSIAGVLVEPVQSRNPAVQPAEFLRELRRITEEADVPLIFDETITGFRTHPGGAQAHFGIQADISVYGKSVGGSLPMAVLAGKAEYMDAYDGGQWQFGDDSFPEVGVTFLGGTFVRHPATLASSLAIMQYLKDSGPKLQEQVNERTVRMASELNRYFDEQQVALQIDQFASLFIFRATDPEQDAALLFPHLRMRGVHIYEDYPCFLSEAHTDDDIDQIVTAVKDSVQALRAGGFLTGNGSTDPDPGSLRHSDETSQIQDQPTPTGVVADEAGPSARFVSPTDGQMEIWVASELSEAASCTFIMSTKIDLRGNLKLNALREAMQQVVDRHDALRMRFSEDGSRMELVPDPKLELSLLDLSGKSGEERAERLAAVLDEQTRLPFVLSEGPLIRFVLCRLEPDYNVLVIAAHHSVCDGWSLGVIIRELAHCYTRGASGEPIDLRPAAQFADYVKRQESYRATSEYAENAEFWVEQFSPPPPVLDLPGDRTRPQALAYGCANAELQLSREEYQAVQKLAADQGCTAFAVLLSAYQLLLHRLSQQQDFSIGLFMAGQTQAEDQDLVGHCVNFLPIRSRVDKDRPFESFLSERKLAMFDVYDHQQFTYGSLLSKLALKRDQSRAPLVSTTFTLESDLENLGFQGLEASVRNNYKAYCRFDLEFYALESVDGLLIDCHYNADVFDADTVRRFMDGYKAILASVSSDPSVTLGTVDLLSKQQKQIMFEQWNNTQTQTAAFNFVDEALRASVDQRRESVAVVCPGRASVSGTDQLTYADLSSRANSLTRSLLARGVRPGDLVGLSVARSPDLVTAMLAIWQAGAAYVPLDPGFPSERLAYMISDSGLKLVVTQSEVLSDLPSAGFDTICLDRDADEINAESSEPFGIDRGSDGLAYVIYTSGSTGTPKGVAVKHESVLNFLHAMAKKPGFDESDRLLAVTTLSFDISVLELLLPLYVGGQLIIASDEDALSGDRLDTLLRNQNVTVMQATPATWQLLLDSGWEGSPSLKVLCGGEALPSALATRLLPKCAELWNMYGPTETTVWSSITQITDAADISIGKPIDNTRVYVLDSSMQPVLPGVTGELFIGGAGVAEGYWRNEKLTQERFLPDPFRAGGRIYRTGDNVKYREDGSLIILGRADSQVKVRGFRIELREIENRLGMQPGVRDCAVVVRKVAEGDLRLVAYWVPDGNIATSTDELRMDLRQFLPHYMLPQHYVQLESMPLTPNGKTDRKALPDPQSSTRDGEPQAPEGLAEELVARVWSDILSTEFIDRRDDFFEIGGHSLVAMRVIRTINSELETDIPLRTLFDNTVLTTFAAAVEHHLENEISDLDDDQLDQHLSGP